MLVSMNFADFSVTFTAEELNIKYDHLDNVCVTMIDFASDSIVDNFITDVTVTRNADSVHLSSANRIEKLGIFELVSFIYPETSSFMQVFENYDGEIISFNNKTTLYDNRENVVDPGSVTYVITGYNNESSIN